MELPCFFFEKALLIMLIDGNKLKGGGTMSPSSK